MIADTTETKLTLDFVKTTGNYSRSRFLATEAYERLLISAPQKHGLFVRMENSWIFTAHDSFGFLTSMWRRLQVAAEP